MYSSLLQNESSLQGKIKIFSRISDSEETKCWGAEYRHFYDGMTSAFMRHAVHLVWVQQATCPTDTTYFHWKTTWVMLSWAFAVLLGQNIFSFYLQHAAHILISFVPPGEDHTQLLKPKDRKLLCVSCHAALAGMASLCEVTAEPGHGTLSSGATKTPPNSAPGETWPRRREVEDTLGVRGSGHAAHSPVQSRQTLPCKTTSYVMACISYFALSKGKANGFLVCFFFLCLGQTYHQTASSSLH